MTRSRSAPGDGDGRSVEDGGADITRGYGVQLDTEVMLVSFCGLAEAAGARTRDAGSIVARDSGRLGRRPGETSVTDDGNLTQFLVRAVLDAEFRHLARRSPDEAFKGYDLRDTDKAAIRSGDAGMLRLLGAALASTEDSASQTTREDDSAESPPSAAAAAGTTPPPVPLQPIALRVTIQPWAQQTPAGLQLTFTSAIEHAGEPAGEQPDATEPAASGPTPRRPWTAWDHDVESGASRAAAAAVHEAAASDRHARVLELLQAVTSGEHLGGDDARDER